MDVESAWRAFDPQDTEPGCMRAAFTAGWVAAHRSAARLCREWAAGSGVVNDAEGRPLDPREDIETAGDQLAEAIEAAVAAVDPFAEK